MSKLQGQFVAALTALATAALVARLAALSGDQIS